MVLSSQMLELNQVQLESFIRSELEENPALERYDFSEEVLTDEAILRSIAPQELKPGSTDREFTRSLPPGSQDQTDWMEFATSSDSLQAHLRGQLLSELPSEFHGLIEYVTESLSSTGYLETTAEAAALAMGTSLEDAERVIAELKLCEPAGVGAQSLQECLALQLRDATTLEAKLARQIVVDRFDDLVHRSVRTLARAYRALPEVIERAFAEVAKLNPHPGQDFCSHSGHRPGSFSRAVTPDLTFTRTEQGWQIEVRGADPTQFTVNRAYSDRLGILENKINPDKEEKQHLAEHVDRAKRFIDSIGHRNKTMTRIGEYLVTEQAGFISTGDVKHLRSLTRSRLALALGLHESAVSRATADKFVQLANGDVIAFEMFFNSALRVQQAIREILEHENPNRPLSDERIAAMLAEQGINIARRTVNKYRDKSRLLSSRRRKSA